MMFYVGIDVHRKQITVCIRDTRGDITLRRQVSTRPGKIRQFLEELQDDYVVLLEVCGFEEWLVKWLQREVRCRDVVILQPESRNATKTDRRDANRLSEMLWVNRDRLAGGEKLQGIRRVYQPTEAEQQDRRLTSMRHRLVRQRTRTLNQVHYLLRRHNLEWEQPTKTFQTKKVRRWLEGLELPSVERLELNQLLEEWDLLDKQLDGLNEMIQGRFCENEAAHILFTIPGVSHYMALSIACRIGDIRRFPNGRSLANFLGLTPGCGHSGDTRRPGSITKEGSRLVRFMLGQLVLHLLRRDAGMRTWYKRIKQRRGSKIARVAVMRRSAVIIWHMLSKGEAYRGGGRTKSVREEAARLAEDAVRDAFLQPLPSPGQGGASAEPDGDRGSTGSSSLLPDGKEGKGCLA